MAIYNVQSDGNAPKNATTGDYVVTAGGTYEVLDGSKYSSMSKEELANAGVGYNPSSGLYSKKVSNISPNDYSALNTDSVEKWLSASNKKATADLDSAYAANKQNLSRTYNSSLSDYEQQKADVRQNYLDNITNLYEDTYYNNAKALENASARGLTSSGLGNAMVVSGLVDASNQNAYYRASRDNDLNKITSAVNALTNNYKVDLDALNAKLSADKNAALSENEIAYLNALMSLEQYNNQMYNDMLKTKQQQDYEKEMYLLQLANSGGYGGGYSGGYGRSYGGGYYGGGNYNGGSYYNESSVDDDYAKACTLYDRMKASGLYTKDQLERMAKVVGEVGIGQADYDYAFSYSDAIHNEYKTTAYKNAVKDIEKKYGKLPKQTTQVVNGKVVTETTGKNSNSNKNTKSVSKKGSAGSFF